MIRVYRICVILLLFAGIALNHPLKDVDGSFGYYLVMFSFVIGIIAGIVAK